MNDIEFSGFIVVAGHATGSSMDGTRQFVWVVGSGRRGFRRQNVAGAFPDTDAGRQSAERLAVQLTERNEPF